MGACQAQPSPRRTVSKWPDAWVLVATLLWGSSALAQAAFDPEQCARPPAPGASVADAQAHFDSLAPHCLRHAGYYRLHGQWLLQQGNPSAAIEALERALLLEPEHLGTQLDYAQALLAVGDNASAWGILSALHALPDVPPHLVRLLEQQLQALGQPSAELPAPAGMTSKVAFSQSVGGDSNLNNATTATNVTLTYPELELDLPVADSYQPRSGLTATSVLQWTGLLPHKRQVWVFQAEGRSRHSASAATRYQQTALDATWLQDPTASTQWIGRMELGQFHWGGRKLYGNQRLGLQHQWAHPMQALNCRTAVGLELERRAFPGSRTLDGLYRGGVFTLVCQKGGNLNVQLRAGVDQPDQATRVGGEQGQGEMRVQWQSRTGAYQWLTEYMLQHQQDATGYSPLLLRNAVRRVTRQALRLETSRDLAWPEFGNPQWFGSIELASQTSNLQVFASSRQAVQTGLRWAWP